MTERGSGQTKQQLIECIESARAGVSVAFIVGSSKEVRYVFHLCQHLQTADQLEPNRLRYGSGEVRIASLGSDPERFYGWRGRIEFDHDAFRELVPAYVEREWLAVAHGCNVRLGAA